MNSDELLNSKIKNDITPLITDIASGDPHALDRFKDLNLDMGAIKTALNFINKSNLTTEQKANILSESWRLNFRSKPPTVEEFLSYDYLGATYNSMRDSLKKVFREFLDPNSQARNLILYPHISWGKSTLSVIIILYITVCVSLMIDPHKYFGLAKSGSICMMFVSYTLTKARELLVSPFSNILESSPYFEKVTRRDKMFELLDEFKQGNKPVDKLYYTTATSDKSSLFEFDSGLSFKLSSSPQALLGLNILCIVFSELAFFTDAGKSSEYVMRLYNDGLGRIHSRFYENYYSRSILDSSPNSLTNAIDDFIVNEAPKNPSNYIVRGAVWEWQKDDFKAEFENGETFKVFTGGKGQPPKILDVLDPLNDEPSVQNKILLVPNSLKQDFIADINKALKDRAGLPSGVADSLISDYSVIEKMFDNNLKNIYTSIVAPANENPTHLIWNQIQNVFFKNKGGKFEFYYLPNIERCISIDQSVVNDVTSISMTHIERDAFDNETHYVCDFTIAIIPDKNRINLESIKCFIEDLKTLGHINITAISFDQFQSESNIQNLKRDGFTVEHLSVDRSTGPYLNLLSLLNRNKISVGKNIFLKNNLKSLHAVHSKKSDNIKIDHDASREQILIGNDDWETSYLGSYGKDVSDSLCASIELCNKYYKVPQVNWQPQLLDKLNNNISSKQEAQNKLNSLLTKMGFK